jgi:hypothetical protein
MRRTASGAAGPGLRTLIKYLRGAAGIGHGTTIKYMRCSTSGAAGNGLGSTNSFDPPCGVAAFEVSLEPHTGARHSCLFSRRGFVKQE